MQSTAENIPRHSVVGKPYCCAWWNGPREIKVQFEDYELARKFQKSGFNCSLTAYAVSGGFLQIFLVKGKTLNWFKRWLARNDQPKKLSEGYGGKIPETSPNGHESSMLSCGKGISQEARVNQITPDRSCQYE